MSVKAPRAWLEVAVPDKPSQFIKWQEIIDLSVENNLFNAADSFEVTLLNSNKQDGKDDKLLSDFLRQGMEVSIRLGYVADPNRWEKEELDLVFTGKIDGVRPLFAGRQTVKIIGRDYSCELINSEFSIAYAERTAAQMAEQIAQKHNLSAKITPTTLIIERDLYKDKKEWDVLQALADREGFVCYVTKNKELYFGPRKEKQEVKAAYRYWDIENPEQMRILGVEFDESMLEIINWVIVRHWEGSTKQLIEAVAKNEKLLEKSKPCKRVIYSAKAITQDLAQAEADKALQELSRSVVTGEQLKVEGDSKIEAEDVISIANVGRFSGNYYVESVRHSYSQSGGYLCEMKVTNLRPDEAAQYRDTAYDEDQK